MTDRSWEDELRNKIARIGEPDENPTEPNEKPAPSPDGTSPESVASSLQETLLERIWEMDERLQVLETLGSHYRRHTHVLYVRRRKCLCGTRDHDLLGTPATQVMCAKCETELKV